MPLILVVKSKCLKLFEKVLQFQWEWEDNKTCPYQMPLYGNLKRLGHRNAMQNTLEESNNLPHIK